MEICCHRSATRVPDPSPVHCFAHPPVGSLCSRPERLARMISGPAPNFINTLLYQGVHYGRRPANRFNGFQPQSSVCPRAANKWVEPTPRGYHEPAGSSFDFGHSARWRGMPVPGFSLPAPNVRLIALAVVPDHNGFGDSARTQAQFRNTALNGRWQQAREFGPKHPLCLCAGKAQNHCSILTPRVNKANWALHIKCFLHGSRSPLL